MRRALSALIAALALVVAGCGGGDDEKSSKDGTGGGSPAAETAPAETSESRSPGGCQPTTVPPQRDPGKHEKPTEPLDPKRKWTLEVQTNCGDFRIALDLDTGPKAAASLVALARDGYFRDTLFHRIAPGFVIQGGDPTGTGSGGPGYSTVDRPPRNAKYTRGVVAMAKAGPEPSGAGGSQFFVVTGPDAGLPPDYAVVGKVSGGMDVVQRIGRLGDPNEQPTEPVVISNIRVIEE